MKKMPRHGEIRRDKNGFEWRVDLRKSSKYPNGMFNVVWFEDPRVPQNYTYTRYNEAGQFIDGNYALA